MMKLSKYQARLSSLGVAVLCGVAASISTSLTFGQSSTIQGDPCTVTKSMKDADASAQADACFTKAHEAAERERVVLMARIKKAIDDEEEADLVKADGLWIQYRDATCMAEWRLYIGPFGGPVAETACLAAETRLRTASLTRTYGSRLKNAGE
jgi:uncharacterized protein YecT (DUF1311 family)